MKRGRKAAVAAALDDLQVGAPVEKIRARVGADRVLHIPVWATLDESLGRDSTHRTRSFLFAALGAVTACLFGLDRIAFFENGVVSLNLPPVAQVVAGSDADHTPPGHCRLSSNIFGAAKETIRCRQPVHVADEGGDRRAHSGARVR
jgi:hypothetical protein